MQFADSPSTSLAGRVALVTGAARGIGLATARLLQQHGAHVVAGDLDGSELDAAFAGSDVVQVDGDLTVEGVPERLVQAAVDTWGRLDIVVNNAGYTLDGPLHRMSDERFTAMLDIHATAPFRLLRAAAPHLREAAKSEQAAGTEVFRKVVNVTSVSGTMGNAGQANYAAGKAAIVGLTKSLAKEWGPLRINVNAVAFGFIDTRLTAEPDPQNVARIGDRDVQLGMPGHLRGMAEMISPIGRAGTPAEAAGPILFLCSPLSDYVTGQVLTVSGGLPLGMSG